MCPSIALRLRSLCQCTPLCVCLFFSRFATMLTSGGSPRALAAGARGRARLTAKRVESAEGAGLRLRQPLAGRRPFVPPCTCAVPRAARRTLLAAAATGVPEGARTASSMPLVDFFRQASPAHPAHTASLRSGPHHSRCVPAQASPYIAGHRGRTFVVVIPGSVVASAALDGVLADVALCHALGVRLVLVVGCSEQARWLARFSSRRECSRPHKLLIHLWASLRRSLSCWRCVACRHAFRTGCVLRTRPPWRLPCRRRARCS